jgi:hypothetical protein
MNCQNYVIADPKTGNQIDFIDMENNDDIVYVMSSKEIFETNDDIQNMKEKFISKPSLFLQITNDEKNVNTVKVVEHNIISTHANILKLKEIINDSCDSKLNIVKGFVESGNGKLLRNKAYNDLLNDDDYDILERYYDNIYGAIMIGNKYESIGKYVLYSHLNGYNIQLLDVENNKAWLIKCNETDWVLTIMINDDDNDVTKFKVGKIDKLIHFMIMPGQPLFGVDGMVASKSRAQSTIKINCYDYNLNAFKQITINAGLVIKPSRLIDDEIISNERHNALNECFKIYAPRPQFYGNEFDKFDINEYGVRAINIFNRDHKADRYDYDIPDGVKSSSYKCVIDYPKSLGGNIIRNSHILNGDRLEQSLFYSSSPRKLFQNKLKSSDNVVCILRNYIKYDGINRALVSVFVNIDERGKSKNCYIVISYIERISQMLLTSFSYEIIYSENGEVVSLKSISKNGPNCLKDERIIPGMEEMSNDIFDAICLEIERLNTYIKHEINIIMEKIKGKNRKVSLKSSMLRVVFSSKHGKSKSQLNINEKVLIEWLPRVLRSTGSRFGIITYNVPLSVRDSMSCRVKSNSMQLRDELTLSFNELESVSMSHKLGCRAVQNIEVNKWNKEITMPCGKVESFYNQMLHHHNCILDMQSFRITSNDEKCHSGFVCENIKCGNYFPSNILRLACCKELRYMCDVAGPEELDKQSVDDNNDNNDSSMDGILE